MCTTVLCYIFVLVPTIYVSFSNLYVCPDTSIHACRPRPPQQMALRYEIPLYECTYLLYMCPPPTYMCYMCHMCPLTYNALYVCAGTYYICVLLPYICVLRPTIYECKYLLYLCPPNLYMCPDTNIRARIDV